METTDPTTPEVPLQPTTAPAVPSESAIPSEPLPDYQAPAPADAVAAVTGAADQATPPPAAPQGQVPYPAQGQVPYPQQDQVPYPAQGQVPYPPTGAAPAAPAKKGGKAKVGAGVGGAVVVLAGAGITLGRILGGIPDYDEANVETINFGNTTVAVDTSWEAVDDGSGEVIYADFVDPKKTGANDPVNAQINLLTEQWADGPVSAADYAAAKESLEPEMAGILDQYVGVICAAGTQVNEATPYVTSPDANTTWSVSFDKCDVTNKIGTGTVQWSGYVQITLGNDGVAYTVLVAAETKIWDKNIIYFQDIGNSFDANGQLAAYVS
ncbi:MAG: hypothetical protein LBR33_03220 [Propionibacteriaceae bacterium]|jgi:hypothetical protein|nr:hypothetical protein [Propionibacteriaceae bacterium]